MTDHTDLIAQVTQAIGTYSVEICRPDAELAPPRYLTDALNALAAAIESQAAEIARLKAERDSAETWCSAALNEIERLSAENDGLHKDAERYRWLRRNCQWGFEEHDSPQLIHRNGETGPHQNPRWRQELDAAIDVERLAKEGGK